MRGFAGHTSEDGHRSEDGGLSRQHGRLFKEKKIDATCKDDVANTEGTLHARRGGVPNTQMTRGLHR